MHPINQPRLIYSNSACAKIDCSTIDFSNVLSVVDGLCTACVGTNTEDCTLATCSDGYWMYLNGACNRIDCSTNQCYKLLFETPAMCIEGMGDIIKSTQYFIVVCKVFCDTDFRFG